MKFKKVLSWLTVVGLSGALGVAVMGRQGATSSHPLTAGLGIQMSAKSALSAVVGTAIGGSANSLNEIALLGDLDGREDLVADHALKVADVTSSLQPGQTLTRFAISEHTVANGFAENLFYYGDSLGNVTVGADTNNDGLIDTSFVINLPTTLNAFGTLNGDEQIVVTGLTVNPVADLTSFSNVNGSFASYSGQIGEILYVTFTDTSGGFRATGSGAIIRSGVLAFPVADITSAAAAPPGIISPIGFPVQMGGAFGVAFSIFSNTTGVAVDDDGSVYFQQADGISLTGANIVKITPVGTNNTRSLATSGFLTLTTLNPANGVYGTSSGPAAQVNRFTNYSGTSTFFGNIAAIAAGPSNVLYAAVARSRTAGDAAGVQNTEGPFQNSPKLGPTPSMIISFADAVSGTNNCNAALTAPNGIADVIVKNQPLMPGFNNFRTFVMGTGPDRRVGGSAAFGNVQNTRKIDFQVDYTIYSGITVDEEGKVYVISGGTPAGVGSNPSPNRGEILLFPDDSPYDRRADYVDLRGEVIPNPAVTSGNVGNRKADRFDYIFWEAPIDPVTSKPIGVAGLARGFLLYTNRTHPVTGTSLDLLPNGAAQLANSTAGPINFENFDPGHQVAGGDDQNFPFRGDDSDGHVGPSNPAIAGPLMGGFEYVFGGNISGTCTSPWNAFFLNSNGNVTFGAGDTSAAPTVSSLLAGSPRIAPAWANLDTQSRALAHLNTFPVQAMGFAGINDFKVRWIDVPEAGSETCGSSNTFEVSLYDDGTGVDENATQPLNPANPIGNNAVPFDLQEGPTDLRFDRSGVGKPPRPDGSGYFRLHYAHMDLIGTAASPDIVGYSLGDQNPSPPNLCTTADLGNLPFGQLIGDGSQAAGFEFFNTGVNGTPLTADFGLRFEGANRTLATPVGQIGQNRDTLWWNGADCSTAGVFTCPK
jgi:hypothetical protein